MSENKQAGKLYEKLEQIEKDFWSKQCCPYPCINFQETDAIELETITKVTTKHKEVLDEAKADFPKFAFMVPELAEAKINAWREKWFGESK